MQSGFINLLKPSGISSNFVLNKIKKYAKKTKVGHLGTLDPLACGVLPVAIGKATKLFDYFLQKKKTYRAIIVFGKETDTLDSEGKIVKNNDFLPDISQFINACKTFIGKSTQIAPIYSANNINGKRAYELARQGQIFTPKSKEIEIYSIDFIEQIDENKFSFEVDCSSGTYIRSLCRDIAYKLNTVAYMGALIRLRCGDFDIENSILTNDLSEEIMTTRLIPIDKALSSMAKLNVSHGDKKDLMCGKSILIKDCIKLQPNKEFLIYCDDEFLGIGKLFSNNRIKLEIHLY